MRGTTTGPAPDSSRGIGTTAATGPAGTEGSGETALAGVGAALRLDLIVLRRRGPLLLLPLALALFITMDVLAASALYAAIGLPLGVHPGRLLVLPLVLIVGQALGIPVFLHFGPGRGLLVWAVSILVVSILVIGALGLLVSSFGPIRDLAAGTAGGGLLLALGAGVLLGLWVLSHRLYLKQDQ